MAPGDAVKPDCGATNILPGHFKRIGETVMIQRLHLLLTVVLGIVALGSLAALVAQHRRAEHTARQIRSLTSVQSTLQESLDLERRDQGPKRRDYATLPVGDRIRLKSGAAPQEFSHLATVARDGKALFRYLGWIDAAGRSLDSLERELEETYEPHFGAKPDITLFLESAVGEREPIEDPLVFRAGDLLSIMSGYRLGDFPVGRVVEVSADGSIWLPAVGRLEVAGMTRARLEETLSESYGPLHVGPLEIHVVTHSVPSLQKNP